MPSIVQKITLVPVQKMHMYLQNSILIIVVVNIIVVATNQQWNTAATFVCQSCLLVTYKDLQVFVFGIIMVWVIFFVDVYEKWRRYQE